MGAIEQRDFTLSLTDEETLRRPRLPFWHIDYFTQPQLDDPEFFLTPDWTVPDFQGQGRGPSPVDVLGLPREAPAAALRPERLCPSPPPEPQRDDDDEGGEEEEEGEEEDDDDPDTGVGPVATLDWVSSSHSPSTLSD